MDNSTPSSGLMRLPIEIRHHIFKYAANASKTNPKKILRYWFEKKEVNEINSQHAATNPDGPAPRVIYQKEYEEDSDGSDEDDEAGENELDQEDDDENDDDDEDQISDDEAGTQDEEEEEEEESLEDDEASDVESDFPPLNQPASIFTWQTLTDPSSLDSALTTDQAPDSTLAQAGGDQSNPATEDQDARTNESTNAEDDQEIPEDDDGNTEADEAEESQDDQAAVIQPAPQLGPIVGAHPKWRHIPNFMQLSRNPPPIELLLASKQLHSETKDWYYDASVLRVDATASFAHTSFFEEAFQQIISAAFSPMESIRRVQIRFVWDSTWIRSTSTSDSFDASAVQAIFPALLHQRAVFVHQILTKAPDLREVLIDWHDSAHDDESMGLMLDTLQPFYDLPAMVKVEEHYIEPDARPKTNSVAGRRRVEFQGILEAGLERLF